MSLRTEVFECPAVELSIIIDNDDMGKSKKVNDWFAEEDFDLALDDTCKGFRFHPLSKVVDGDG